MQRLILHLSLVLLLASPVWATNTLGHLGALNATGTSTTPTSSGSSDETGYVAGDGFVGFVIWSDTTATLSNCTLTGESAPTLIGSPQTGSNRSIQFAYLKSLAGSGTKTFACTLSSSVSWHMGWLTLHGQDTTSFYDSAECGAAGSSASASCSMTTNSANTTIVQAAADGGSSDLTPTAPATVVDIALINFINFEEGAYTLDTGAAGSKTVTETLTSANWIIKAAAFKTSAGGGATCPKTLALLGVGC